MTNAPEDDIIGFHTLRKAMVEGGAPYIARIPDEWRQGRTVFGGLTAGLALAAARAEFGALTALRSMSCAFIGPVTGAPR